jgi:hypothetical protein
MARPANPDPYSRLPRSIWTRKPFTSASKAAQHSLLMLLTQASLSACGVTPMTIKRWAILANSSVEVEREALAELVAKGLILVDEDTEEAWVVDHISDDLLPGRDHLVSVNKAHHSVVSEAIRAAITDRYPQVDSTVDGSMVGDPKPYRGRKVQGVERGVPVGVQHGVEHDGELPQATSHKPSAINHQPQQHDEPVDDNVSTIYAKAAKAAAAANLEQAENVKSPAAWKRAAAEGMLRDQLEDMKAWHEQHPEDDEVDIAIGVELVGLVGASYLRNARRAAREQTS